FLQQFGPRLGVDGSVHPSPTEQRFVGSVDDGIDRERSKVAHDKPDPAAGMKFSLRGFPCNRGRTEEQASEPMPHLRHRVIRCLSTKPTGCHAHAKRPWAWPPAYTGLSATV